MRLGNFFDSTDRTRTPRASGREEFVHRFLAGAGDRLIGRHDDALDRRAVMQGLKGDDELRGRAIRVGDDVALAEARDSVGVHFRHDERHVGIVAPLGGVIDHHAALRADLRRPFLRHRSAGRHQADVGVGEIIGVEVAALERLVAEGDFRADGAAGGERNDLAHRKAAFGENVEKLAAHVAGGSCDGDLETHDRDPVWRPLRAALKNSPSTPCKRAQVNPKQPRGLKVWFTFGGGCGRGLRIR